MPFKGTQIKVKNLPQSYGIPPDFQWSQSSILFLIKIVHINFNDFYNKTIKKKMVWKRLASVMNERSFFCTAEECDKKWRNLKKTYLSVLQKQVQGDFSSKFTYFSKMHTFVGKEVDPLGMREKRLSTNSSGKIGNFSGRQPKHFKDLEYDGDFIWTDSSVKDLLYEITTRKNDFDGTMLNQSIKIQIDNIWKVISLQINLNGYITDYIICQRKWINLRDGFRYHQGMAENLGICPLWPYWDGVRSVINAINVSVGIYEDQIDSVVPSTSTIDILPTIRSNESMEIDTNSERSSGSNLRSKQIMARLNIISNSIQNETKKSFGHVVPSTSADDVPTINKNGESFYNESIEMDISEGRNFNKTQIKFLIAKVLHLNNLLDLENYSKYIEERKELLDELVRQSNEQNELIKDILQRIQNCNMLLQSKNSAVSSESPQNSVITISDDPSLLYNIVNDTVKEEYQNITIHNNNELFF